MFKLPLYSMLRHHLVGSRIGRCEGSFYFLLLKELKNLITGLINIQNDNNECFRWSL